MPNRPRVDLLTGKFAGYAYSGNIGWINLGTDLTTTAMQVRDDDGDGMDDAWERETFGNTTTATPTSQSDTDGVSDRDEFRANTNPQDPGSYFQIVSSVFDQGVTQATVVFTSSPTRVYRLLICDQLGVTPFNDSGLGTFAPDAGTTTTRVITWPGTSRKLIRVASYLPLTTPLISKTSPEPSMNIPSIRSLRRLGATLIAGLLASTAFSQGSLTPPAGAPGPTQKTLQQIWDKIDALETQARGLQDQVGTLQNDNAALGILLDNAGVAFALANHGSDQHPGAILPQRDQSCVLDGLAVPGHFPAGHPRHQLAGQHIQQLCGCARDRLGICPMAGGRGRGSGMEILGFQRGRDGIPTLGRAGDRWLRGNPRRSNTTGAESADRGGHEFIRASNHDGHLLSAACRIAAGASGDQLPEGLHSRSHHPPERSLDGKCVDEQRGCDQHDKSPAVDGDVVRRPDGHRLH
jgi:hypothetical protein